MFGNNFLMQSISEVAELYELEVEQSSRAILNHFYLQFSISHRRLPLQPLKISRLWLPLAEPVLLGFFYTKLSTKSVSLNGTLKIRIFLAGSGSVLAALARLTGQRFPFSCWNGAGWLWVVLCNEQLQGFASLMSALWTPQVTRIIESFSY